MNVKASEIDCCPHCFNDFGYYVIQTMRGRGERNYGFNGGEVDNSEMHECLEYFEQKAAYCIECRKKIGPVK